MLDALGEDRCDEIKLFNSARERLAVPLADVDDGRDAERYQEGDDQDRHRAAEHRLGGQQPPIGGLRDRLRKSLN